MKFHRPWHHVFWLSKIQGLSIPSQNARPIWHRPAHWWAFTNLASQSAHHITLNVDVKHYNAVYLAYRNTGSHNHRYDMYTKTNTALYSSARQALYGTTFSDKTLPTDRKNNWMSNGDVMMYLKKKSHSCLSTLQYVHRHFTIAPKVSIQFK